MCPWFRRAWQRGDRAKRVPVPRASRRGRRCRGLADRMGSPRNGLGPALLLDGRSPRTSWRASRPPPSLRRGSPGGRRGAAPLGRTPGRRTAHEAGDPGPRRGGAPLEAAARGCLTRGAASRARPCSSRGSGALDETGTSWWDRLVRAGARATAHEDAQRGTEDRVGMTARALDSWPATGWSRSSTRRRRWGSRVALANRARWFEIQRRGDRGPARRVRRRAAGDLAGCGGGPRAERARIWRRGRADSRT